TRPRHYTSAWRLASFPHPMGTFCSRPSSLLRNPGEEARAELALPSGMVGSFITEWRPRIILPALPLGYDVSSLPEPEDEEIDVEVQRRAT
ncbi:MAG: hypothetical protein ACYCZN_08785, partial [Candidatus Dormibacteria bacterium]